MRTFIKFLIAFGMVPISLLTAAEPSIRDLPLPKFRKGIWATRHYQEITGKPARQYRENVLDQCADPADSMRRGLLSGKKGGCVIKLESQTGSEIVFSSTCPQGALRFTVAAPSPTEYKLTTTSEQVRDVQAGRWVRDCPNAATSHCQT